MKGTSMTTESSNARILAFKILSHEPFAPLTLFLFRTQSYLINEITNESRIYNTISPKETVIANFTANSICFFSYTQLQKFSSPLQFLD